jgi:putative DNA primase/helicase
MSTPEATDSLEAAMVDFGLTPPTIKWTGKIERFSDPPGKRNNNGWVIAHPDKPMNATFGTWRDQDRKGKWSFCGSGPDDRVGPHEFRQDWKEKEAKRRAERNKEWAIGAATCQKKWVAETTRSASAEHPYLVGKGIADPYDIRQAKDTLFVPMKDAGGSIVSIQYIDAEGGKRFAKGTHVKGARTTIGARAFKKSNLIYVTEGWATGATIHLVTGEAVVVAFSAGNLPEVTEGLRKKYPKATIIVASDNDRWSSCGDTLNPGVTYAHRAAESSGALLAIPDFTALESKPTDFNDLYLLEGAEAVIHWLDPANAAAAATVSDGEDGAEPTEPCPEAGSNPERPDAADDAPDHLPEKKGATRAPILSPKDPYPGAQEFQRRHYELDGTRTLHEQGGVFYAYTGAAYPEAEVSAIRAHLWEFAERAMRWVKRDGEFVLAPFQPASSKINNLLDALRGVTHLGKEVRAPSWLDSRDDDPPAGRLIAFPNGLLDVANRRLHPPTPRLFTHHAVQFDYAPEAEPPARWLEFLRDLWRDDQNSIEALQEWMGYFLLPDTGQQKIFMIVGPKRSGKGTIARVLAGLLGQHNVCAPTLSGLSTNFGLWPLIGRQLAVVSDARLGGRADQAVIAERLLSISGQDLQTVDRKHLTPWTGKLSTRFLVLTNELPRLQDSSGALASRFLLLSLQRSFYGSENIGLTGDLLKELPGILEWALTGLERLTERGHFVQPEASAEAIRELEDLGSPVAAFVRERCHVGPGLRVEMRKLYQAWTEWCTDQGRDHPGTAPVFGRDLRAVIPSLGVTQPRVKGDRIRRYEGIGLREGAS